MTYHFRKMTNEDLDLLYSHSDAKDWLIPKYGTRDFNVAVERNHSNIAIGSDGAIMLFLFPENFAVNDKGNWFVYFDTNHGLFIFQDRIDFIVFYCSQPLNYLQDNVKSNIIDIFIQGGELLNGTPDGYITEDDRDFVKFISALPNDSGRYQ